MDEKAVETLQEQLKAEVAEAQRIEKVLEELGDPEEGANYYYKVRLETVYDLRCQLAAELCSFLVEAELNFRGMQPFPPGERLDLAHVA